MASRNIMVTGCLCIYQYYSLLLGVNTMRYDREERRVIRSRVKTLYSRCANFALIASMLYAYYTLFMMPAASFARGHELLRVMDLLNIGVQFCMTVWMFLLRFRREQTYMNIIARFYVLDDNYMQRLAHDNALEREVSRLLCAKLFAMLIRMIMAFVLPLLLVNQLTWQNCLLTVYFGNMQNFLPAIVFRYFLALLQAWKRFKLLNVELQRLLLVYDSDETPLSPDTMKELWQLVSVHWQFSQLLQLLSDTYKYQMMGTLITYLIRNIVFSFFVALIIAGRIEMDIITISLGVMTFLAIYVDNYLLYWISELLERAYKQTIEILREHQTENIHAEWLSLQLTQCRLQISMGGMFNLNMQAWLSFLAYILQQTLIWVQFDWSYYKRRNVNQF